MSDLSYFIACEGGCGRKVVVPANAAQDCLQNALHAYEKLMRKSALIMARKNGWSVDKKVVCPSCSEKPTNPLGPTT